MASDEEDPHRNLFASDDEEQQQQQQQQQQQEQEPEEEENGLNYDDAEEQAVPQDDDVEGLFDDDDAPGQGEQEAAGGASEPELDELNDEEDEPAKPRRVVAPPMEISAPLVPLPPAEKAFLMKTSNIVDFEPRPFDADTFQPEEEVYQDDQGVKRVRLRDQNVVRWRWKKAPDGTMQRESNARFVKWSDGSWQLLLGDEVLDVAQLDMSRDHAYVYVLHGTTLQAQAQLVSKLQCRPSSLDSRSHKRLRDMVDKRHTKYTRVARTVTMLDPEKEKQIKEKAAEADNKRKERVSKIASSSQSQQPMYSRSVYRSSMTAHDLEQGDDDDLGAYDAMPSQPAPHLRRTYDEEGEGARKLIAAQHAPPSQSSRHRGRTIEEDEEEEEDDEDYMEQGEDLEGEEEELEERETRRPSQPSRPSAGGSQADRERVREKEKEKAVKDKSRPKAKRGVVMSSDEEE